MEDAARKLDRSPKAVSCDLGSGAAILDIQSNQYFTLNATGMMIWQMLPASPADIIARLSAEFLIDSARIESDVNSVVSQLLKHQLVNFADT